MPPSSPLCDHDSTQSIRQENNLVWGGDLHPHPATRRAPCPRWRTQGALRAPGRWGDIKPCPPMLTTPLLMPFPCCIRNAHGMPAPTCSNLTPPRSIPFPKHHFGGSRWRHQHLPQRPAFRRPNISKKRLCPQLGAQLTPRPTHQALMFPAGPAPAAAPIPTGFSPSDTPSKNCLSLMTAVSTASLGFQKGEKNPWQ